MILHRSLRKSAAVAAMLALVLQAWWPLVSQAAQRERSERVALCTVQDGTQFLEIRLGQTPLEKRTALHGEHCKLCVSGADRLVALPPSSVAAPLVVQAGSRPSALSTAPRSGFLSHPPAQPRAPPADL